MATGLLAAGAAERPAAGPPARKSSPEVRRVPLAFVQLPYRPDSERSAVASLLSRTASRLGSTQLSALAEKASSDPFAKVKGMVQDLIDRLKQEEVNDANHQTWCVEETRKTTREREYRLRTLDKLEEHQRELEATRAALEDQITNLKTQLRDSRKALGNAQALRDRESAENARLLAESADGKAAVEQAISVLETFYSAAAAVEGNATVAAPGDAPSAGFDGVSHGSQSESVGIIGMMTVVRDDFERTITETTESDAAAVREFTVLKRELDAGCKAGGTDGGDGSALTAEDR